MTEPEHGQRHLASHVFNIAILVGGIVALAFMMHRLGWANARDVFEHVGWWFAVILGLDLCAMSCDAAAIHSFMRPEARMISYWRVLAAQASGRAINILTPGGALGEATKITMLVSHAPRDRVVSSIVLFNLATFYLSVAIMVIGIPITALVVDLPHQLALLVWTGLAILVPLVIGLGVVIRRGALETILSVARTLHIVSEARLASWKIKLLEFDRHLKELHGDQSPGTRNGLLLLCLSRLFSWTATTTVLSVIGVRVHPTLLVGVLSVGVLIGWISSIVPFGLGIADVSNYALFDVLGASGAHGAFVTMLGRARSVTIALVGLVVMAAGHTANRISVVRRNRRRAVARTSPTTL